ncbi:MFS transporter [Georgenia halophila]|uniref:MFS transporter n=1 Tax=Georgenia halophila TaxID=620889 RepID=A0ABP8LIC2_9MICO
MSLPARSGGADDARRARAAVSAVFLTNGALLANIAPRLPEIKASLGLSDAAYGTTLAAIPTGALIAGLFAPALIGRFRSSRVATIGIVALAAATFSVSVAPIPAVLAAAFLLMGAVDSVVDVSQNAHGLRVQRIYGRSILNAFHGLWSVGAVTGGLMGSAAAGLGVPLPVHLGISAGIFATVALVALPFMLPGPENAERAKPVVDPNAQTTPRPRRIRVPRPVVTALTLLGVIAVCGALVEDAGSSWAALYLGRDLGAPSAVAGLGFVAVNVAMTVGRLTGDRFVDRFGQAGVVRSGGLLIAAGMGLALALPSVPLTIIGFGAAGLGCATLIPAAMHAGDELPGLAPGVGLTVVSWVLRIGFLASPPLVGFVAEHTSLRVGLLGVVIGGLVAALFAGVLGGRRPRAHL